MPSSGTLKTAACLAAGLLLLSQSPAAEARTKTGRTASELEQPQTWGEPSSEGATPAGNTSGSQSGLPADRRDAPGRPRLPGPNMGDAGSGEKPRRDLGASETMDRLFPLGTPTPEKDELSKEIRIWIHDLGGESHQRQNAIERLSATGERAVPFLLQALKDPYPYSRVGALAALANIRDKAVIPAMERLLTDRAYEVRAEAAKSLGSMKSRDSLAKLAVCLEDRELRVRREAVIALGKLKNAAARDRLVGALQTTTHEDVRQQAVQELSAFPGPETVEALLQATHGRDLVLCVFAIRSLGEVGDLAARSRLIELTRHRDRAVREEAVTALKSLE
jgi:hypothetical protein